MKYMAIIDADEKPVSCEFIGCNGNATPYLIGTTTNIKALEQEPSEDWMDVPFDEMTIEQARQAVKDLRKKLLDTINKAPSATPAQKMGEWIETGYSLRNGHYGRLYECVCSECRGLAYFRKGSLNHALVGAKCCPCCGAKMEVEK